MTQKEYQCALDLLRCIQSKSAGKGNQEDNMADSAFACEIERFITPIRGLYKEYIISVDDLREKNPELFENNVVDTAPVRDGQLIYELYGDGEEGEIVKEHVQTWICDNHQKVTTAVGITLHTKEISFGDWFRASESNKSPDELIVYCLSKLYQKHTVILNKSFAWSTLSNYISYSDLELVQRSRVVLIYVGISKYAVLKPSWMVKPPAEVTTTPTPTKSRKRRTPAKITCRTVGKRAKKDNTVPLNASRTQPVRRTRTLAEKRLSQFGIGGEACSTRSTRRKQVDYLKLNDGYESAEDEPTSPKPKRRKSYLPSRSGPSSTRQRAQTTITSPPAQVLPCVPAKKTASQSKNSPSVVRLESPSPKRPTSSGVQITVTEDTAINPTTGNAPLSGVQPAVSGVQLANAASEVEECHQSLVDTVSGVQTAMPDTQNLSTNIDCTTPTVNCETTDPILTQPTNLPTNEDKLPDLVRTNQAETFNYSLVLDTVPPVGDQPPDNIFDGGTTEEEFDAVDALLSLSTVRESVNENSVEDNASLMPIGGNIRYQDVNPVTVRLDQVSVDGEIAKIVLSESTIGLNNSEAGGGDDTTAATGEQDSIEHPNPTEVPVSGVQNTLSGISSRTSGVQQSHYGDTVETEDADHMKPDKVTESSSKTTLSDVQTASSGVHIDDDDHDTNRKEEETTEETPKGYVKVTTHGIRKNTRGDSRSYRCRICGVKKRSAHNLNVHHKKRHSAEMCGVCGKLFNLASSLNHHMYTHNERRFFCENCSFHCHFESELKKHNISHHSQPSHQCMKRNCSRWFKRKSDLVLHVETHNKDRFECDDCDFTTTLQKYLNEHKKCHENTLPYACSECGKRFLWRSGVRAHKTKEHAKSKPK